MESKCRVVCVAVVLVAAVLVTMEGSAAADRSSADAQVVQVASDGGRVTDGLTSLYEFDEGSGSVVADTSGSGDGLQLSIEDPSKVTWVPGGLRLDAATRIMSTEPAARVVVPSQLSGAVTVEAWVTSRGAQGGPARIVSLSANADTRDVELNQEGSSFQGRVRAGAGGTSSVSGPGVGTTLQHVVFVREPAGPTRLYVNGDLVSSGGSTGSLSTWDPSMFLVLGNVAGSTPRPWLGELHLVATYRRALTFDEVRQNFEVGPKGPTVPGAPTGVSAEVGIRSVTFTFAPPADDGGAPITSYTASCAERVLPRRATTGSGSPLTVTGLEAGEDYVCAVTARNHIGTGAGSGDFEVRPLAPPGSRVTEGLTSLYEFRDGSGSAVRDTSGLGGPLNLTIDDPSKVTWVPGALRLHAATRVSSPSNAQKLIAPSRQSGGVTVEAWVKPSNANQGGPARIVSVSANSDTRNVELNQEGSSFQGRLRAGTGGTSSVSASGVAPALQHVVFVREPAGSTRLYVNGVSAATGTSPGSLSTWDPSMRLVLGNVAGSTPRPWLGELHLVATYDRALTSAEVTQNFAVGADAPTVPGTPTTVSGEAGVRSAVVRFTPPVDSGGAPITSYTASCAPRSHPHVFTATGSGSPITVSGLELGDTYFCSVVATNQVGGGYPSEAVQVVPLGGRVTSGLTSLYEFREGSGSVVTDSSAAGTPLDLTIQDPSKVSWVPGGLRLDAATRLTSAVPAAKVIEASRVSGAVSVEAWVKSSSVTQVGPARIVAVATDPFLRNVELAQDGSSYLGRVRSGTGATSSVTTSSVTTSSVTTSSVTTSSLQHVVYVREPGGTTRLFVDGTLVASGTSVGALSSWDSSMRLALGDVPGSPGRPWLGELHLVATYGRALSSAEVAQNHAAGAD